MPTNGAPPETAAAAAPAASPSAEGSGVVPSASDANERIHAMLIELAEIEKVKGDSMRSNTYYKAARAVKAHTEPITSGKAARKALVGVGKKIEEKIDELLTTGTLARLEKERADPTTMATTQLQRVSGIGSVRALELYTAHGITSVDMLRAKAETTPGLLTHEQKVGLRHVTDFEARIPREEMQSLEQIVRRMSEAHNPPLQMTVCGSYRRGRAESGDIDCLLCHPSFASWGVAEAQWPTWLESLTKALRDEGFVTDTLAAGKKKCALVCRLGGDGREEGGKADGNAEAGSSAAEAEAAPAAPALLKLPSMKDVQAKRAGRAGQARGGEQKADLFATWKAGKESSKEGDEAGGKGESGVGASTSAAASTAAAWDDAETLRVPYRRLDLRLCAFETYHAMTLYFTGSDEHNKLMRSRAIELGYRLNEYGLFKVGEDGEVAERPEPCGSEADIFRLLNMNYATPKERDI